MGFKCNKCEKDIREVNDCAACTTCKSIFHFECSVEKSAYKNQKRWCCSTCNNITRALRSNKANQLEIEEQDDIKSLLHAINKKVDKIDSLQEGFDTLKIFTENITEQFGKFQKKYEEQHSEITSLRVKVHELEKENLEKERKLNDLSGRLAQQEQYVRENNIEIAQLPVLRNENCKDIVLEVGHILGITINANDIQNAFRPKINETHNKIPPIIVKFNNKEIKEKFLSKRKYKITKEGILGGSNVGNTIYINDNMSPYFKNLFWKARQWASNKNVNVWFARDKVLVKKENGEILKITSDLDIQTLQLECDTVPLP